MPDPYTQLAQALDSHVERKTRKVMAPHLDEFAEVISVGPPVVLTFQDSGITLPEDQIYWSPSCPAVALHRGDIVIVVGINNEFHVVGRATHGQHARSNTPIVTGSRGGNAAVTSLVHGLAKTGLIIDNTTP